MPKVELVFFSGCPHVERARRAIREAGIKEFAEVNLDNQGIDHKYRELSSPSILVDGTLFLGAQVSAKSCSVIDWVRATASLRSKIQTSC